MAKDKKSFLLYCDQIHVFESLDDAEAGRLIKHIFQYVNDKNPTTDDKIIKIAFEPIKHQLKRDLVKYETLRGKNSANARKRWDAKQCDGMQTDAKHADTVTVTVTDTVTVKDINNKKISENSDFKGRIKIGNDIFKKPVSKVLKEDFSELFESCMMNQLTGTDETAILAAMDEEYSFYEFRDANHLFNSLKAIKSKISKVKFVKTPKHSKIDELKQSESGARDILGLNNES